MHRWNYVVAIAFLSVAISASAGEVLKKPVDKLSLEELKSTVEMIHSEMAVDKRYEFIKPDDRAKVDADLASMVATLEKFGSVDAMSQSEKVKLFNTQEHVNGLLTRSDSNRLICQHSAPTGSTIPRTSCDTVADIEHNRKESRKMLEDVNRDSSACNIGKFCRSN